MTYTILIADDEPSLRLLVRATLKSAGHTLIEATNGNDALSIARQVLPDLILLDVMMPGLSGFQVCTELRKDKSTERIPVAILTAKGGHEDRDTAKAAGANYFITKPFRPPELLAVVARVFAKREAVSR